MEKFSKCLSFGLAISLSCVVFFSANLNAQVPTPPPSASYAAPYGTPSQSYYNYNNPYTNSAAYPYNNGFYGGFYGTPPPPSPAQSFPDQAQSDALYRYIQNR